MILRTPYRQAAIAVALAVSMTALFSSRAAANEVLCDTAFENCRTRLLALIDAEVVGIDVAFWVMDDPRFYNRLIARKNQGVPVRVIIDTRSLDNPEYASNQTTFDALRQAGIPMIKKSGGGIMHWKTMIFVGQNTVEFGAANYTGFEFVPVSPYTDYISNTVYYTDDPPLVDSFKKKFDDVWVDTASYSGYANVSARTRSYPELATYAISPDLNLPPGKSFTSRLTKLENAETQQIDVAMYRITQQTHGDALIAAFRRGVPVRYLGEMGEYRDISRPWVSYNMDRIYAAGIPMRVSGHSGQNHQKLVLLYGQGMSVFGSSNFTLPSDNSQQEHNYFTTKNWMFQWFQEQYDRQWNNATGSVESKPFVPLPPNKPVYSSIADGAVGVPTTNQKLIWYGGLWAHLYDIYFGTDPSAMMPLAVDQPLGPSLTTKQYQSFALPMLQTGTKYYWKIVAKTMARVAALDRSGPIWSFTTDGTPPPPPPGATTIVLWPSDLPPSALSLEWVRKADVSAAGGASIHNPDRGRAKVVPALASPANFFEMSFTAIRGVPYRLWIRLRAENNSFSNDSVHVQFSDSVDSLERPVMRINTTSSAELVLQNGPAGAPPRGWGWTDNGWGSAGPPIYFLADGTHVIRIQQREDGAEIDQIVLSPDTYYDYSHPPGGRSNDTTILQPTR